MVVPTVTVITASGTYTRPVGSKYIKAFVIGGGGGGGAGAIVSGKGSGGGAGEVQFRFFDETGTYNATIGTGGSTGANGTTTTFSNGANSISAAGGLSGASGASNDKRGGLSQTTIADTRLFAASGSCCDTQSTGNGGSNMFGSGGRGVNHSTDTPGGTGLGFGGGGGGGLGSTGSGGSGANGAVIIFEYY
jgi:hypothetical protein